MHTVRSKPNRPQTQPGAGAAGEDCTLRCGEQVCSWGPQERPLPPESLVPPRALLGFSQEWFYDLEPQAQAHPIIMGATKSLALIKEA